MNYQIKTNTTRSRMIIIDKKYFIEGWKRSILVMIIVIFIIFLENGLILKWLALISLSAIFSIKREIKLNNNLKSIDININFWGLRYNLVRIPINKIEEFSIKQDSRNCYNLVMQKTSGEKIVLLTEDLKVDIDRYFVMVKEFSKT